eukprot:3140487-Pleurochrysis_carterae.AAC.1
MRARSKALAARFARFLPSLALRVSCCAKPAAVSFSSMLGDGHIDEEDVFARAADRQHVLDGAQQLVVKRVLLLAVELRIEPLPNLRADGVPLGGVEGDVL